MMHDLAFVEHVLDSIKAIEEFCRNKTQNDLKDDRKTRSAVIREIEVIGEAVKNISSSTKNKYDHIEWKKISGTRDKMIHHYFGIDLDVIWDIVRVHLPALKQNMLNIRAELRRKL